MKVDSTRKKIKEKLSKIQMKQQNEVREIRKYFQV